MFNRFPNLLGLGLALAIIYHGYIEKDNVKSIINNILVFLARIHCYHCHRVIGHAIAGAFADIFRCSENFSRNRQTSCAGQAKSGLLQCCQNDENYYSSLGGSRYYGCLPDFFSSFFLFFENKLKNWLQKLNILFSLLKIIIIAGLTILVVKGVITNLTVLYLITGVCLIIGCAMICLRFRQRDKPSVLHWNFYFTGTSDGEFGRNRDC